MNIEDKIIAHNNLVKNLEAQKELWKQINDFNRKIELKKLDNPPLEVSTWSMSELENKINEFKDLLHGFKNTYKELHNTIIG